MAEISGIVNVQVSRVAAGTSRRQFGRTGFLGVASAPSVNATTTLAQLNNYLRDVSVLTYVTQNDLEGDYGTSGDVYEAAAKYFAQIPYPRELVVANWFGSGASTIIVGGTGADLPTIQALGATGGDLTLTDGTRPGATTADFTAGGSNTVNSLSAAATPLTTLLDALPGISNAAVVWNTALLRFIITIPAASAGNVTGVFDGDVASAFKIDQQATEASTGAAFFIQGFAAETRPSAALSRMDRINDSFYFLGVANEIEESSANIEYVADWVNTRTKMLFVRGNSYADGSVLDEFRTSGYARVAGIYSREGDYKPMALAGIMSTTNFDAAGGLKDPNRKSLTTCRVDSLTATQLAALDAKSINYYHTRGNDGVFEPGLTFEQGTRYIYEQFWLDWFSNALQTEVWNLLRGSDFLTLDATGVSSLVNVVTQVCESGVTNGGIGPGQLQEALAGEARRIMGVPTFDGYLQLGYLVLAADLDTLQASDLRQGQAPAITVLAKGTRTIRFVDINVKVGD